MNHFAIPGAGRPLHKSEHNTFSPQKVCLSALSGGAAGGGNLIWCYYSQSKWQFRVFVETRFLLLACGRNRHPDESRIRKSHTREDRVPGFHENTEMQLG